MLFEWKCLPCSAQYPVETHVLLKWWLAVPLLSPPYSSPLKTTLCLHYNISSCSAQQSCLSEGLISKDKQLDWSFLNMQNNKRLYSGGVVYMLYVFNYKCSACGHEICIIPTTEPKCYPFKELFHLLLLKSHHFIPFMLAFFFLALWMCHSVPEAPILSLFFHFFFSTITSLRATHLVVAFKWQWWSKTAIKGSRGINESGDLKPADSI